MKNTEVEEQHKCIKYKRKKKDYERDAAKLPVI
jgi:hypothetical protein